MGSVPWMWGSPAATCYWIPTPRPSRFNHSGSVTRLSVSPGPQKIRDVRDLEGKRVATSYPGLGRFLGERRVIQSDIVTLDGAVESAVRLGVADAVADVVSTGATLKAQGLEIFGPVILESEAILISAHARYSGH